VQSNWPEPIENESVISISAYFPVLHKAPEKRPRIGKKRAVTARIPLNKIDLVQNGAQIAKN
jgi:hypothetical protein